MYELIQITEKSYYIQSPSKMGLVKLSEHEVCLIDSGNDKEAGRKVRQILDANNWTLKYILNTHSNADHIGGNQYLTKQTGCKVYAKGMECYFTRNPILTPSFLYGAFPPKDLRNKFLLAKESESEDIANIDLPDGFEVIELPGHFFDMIGFRTPDDVVYLADCLSSKETLEKYQVSFIYDVDQYLNTLEMVKNLKAKMFVPAHTEPTDDISSLAQYNIDKVHEIADLILEFCKEPLNFEVILQKLFNHYNLTLNFEQYILVGSTIKSYLAWLKDLGKVSVSFENSLMLWNTI